MTDDEVKDACMRLLPPFKRPKPKRQPSRLQRAVARVVRVRQDAFGEWRFYLFGRYTALTWMHPSEWRQGWWLSWRKNSYAHGQTIFGLRCCGFDFHWSRFR